MTIEWMQVKQVLIAAHLPDVKFEAHTSSSAVDAMPVSALILELRKCLYKTTYVNEYKDFLAMIQFPCDDARQAKAIKLGHKSLLSAICGKDRHKVKNIKRHIEETLIEDGVCHMPMWLYFQCRDIYEINLKGSGELW